MANSCNRKILPTDSGPPDRSETQTLRVILPGGDQAAKCIDETLLIGLTQNKRYVDAHIARDSRYLAEMIDLFGCSARDDQLVEFGGPPRQHSFKIEMRPANLAVCLDRQYASEEIVVLRIHFV